MWIESTSHNAVISKSYFQSNANFILSGSGGAMYLQLSGKPNCTVSCDNKVEPSGNEPVVSIVGCTFISNAGGLFSGTIHAFKGILNVSNNNFSQNTAPVGGVMTLSSNLAYFHENIFTNNRATTIGGYCVFVQWNS